MAISLLLLLPRAKWPLFIKNQRKTIINLMCVCVCAQKNTLIDTNVIFFLSVVHCSVVICLHIIFFFWLNFTDKVTFVYLIKNAAFNIFMWMISFALWRRMNKSSFFIVKSYSNNIHTHTHTWLDDRYYFRHFIQLLFRLFFVLFLFWIINFDSACQWRWWWSCSENLSEMRI